jgi:hypothetical protein
MAIEDVVPNNLRFLEERVKRQQDRVSELRQAGADTRNAVIVLDVMTESLVRLIELQNKNNAKRKSESAKLLVVNGFAK